jgi:penicillin amidase
MSKDMKRALSGFVGMVLSIGCIYLLNNSHDKVPALGPLLCPATGYLQNGERADQLVDQTLPEGLVSQQSYVVMDSHLIPHIFAANDDEAYKLQGYLEAKYRFWQMDFVTKVAAGRVSEAVGKVAIDFDKSQRRKGLAAAAKTTINNWKKNKKSYAYLEAYSEGVNAYLNSISYSKRPIEYKLLGYDYEPWTTEKTAIFFKQMADVLCSRERDFEMSNAKTILGQKLFDFIYAEFNSRSSPVIPSEKKYAFENVLQETTAVHDSIDQPLILKRPYTPKEDGLGSNNWAVAPEKSVNGKALLANDPHLQLRLPSVWYLVHIHTTEYNSMGVSFPGTPGIMLGFNEHIAWGVTNVGHDVLDWMTLDWVEKWKTYRIDDQVYTLEWRQEQFNIKDDKPIQDSIPWTILGPIWTTDTEDGEQDFIMKWLAHEAPTSDEMSVFPTINRAKDYDEFLKAIEPYSSPAQNFVFASNQGKIAMRVQGNLPLRKRGYGRAISTSSNDHTWDSYIPNEHLPMIQDPAQGFVSSANQTSTDTSYPYYYIDGDFREPRAQTINKTLDELKTISVDDMKALQLNPFDKDAYDFVQAALPYLSQNDEWTAVIKNWDGRFEASSEVSTLIDLWKKQFLSQLYDEIYIDGKKLTQFPFMWRTNELIDSFPDHEIFDIKATEKVEIAKDILSNSYYAAKESFEKLESKKWYKYRNSRISHIIPSLVPFGAFDIPSDGTGSAPNALRLTQGPSWRMVVELGQEMAPAGIYPGGQSGHGGSRYYDNFLPLWIQGEYLNLDFPSSPDELTNPMFTLKSKSN